MSWRGGGSWNARRCCCSRFCVPSTPMLGMLARESGLSLAQVYMVLLCGVQEQEQMRQERMRQEQIRQEHMRQEQMRQQEMIRQQEEAKRQQEEQMRLQQQQQMRVPIGRGRGAPPPPVVDSNSAHAQVAR
jgi:hypothetical protein